MSNQEKQLVVRELSTGKEVHMTKDGFEHGKTSRILEGWEQIKFTRPDNVLELWYVDEAERNKAITSRKPFCEPYKTDTYFRIVKRIDSSFIEGFIGHKDYLLEFFAEMPTHYSYFSDYLSRRKIYFSFDKITLFQVTEIIKDNPLRLILKRLDTLPTFEANTAFMIMPFKDDKLNEFYENNIRKHLKDTMNIDVYTAANFTDNDIIIETIYKRIEQSEFIIAETTKDNKNVFYELGYAVAKEREVITIQNEEEKTFFFDRAHVRSITYSVENLARFKENLIATINTIRSRK